MRERRRNHRRHLLGRVRLELGDKVFEFPAADISVSGVGVLLDLPVVGERPHGQVGICLIDSPDLAAPVEAYVSVMRIRKVGERHLLGLRFESISDEQLATIQDYENARES